MPSKNELYLLNFPLYLLSIDNKHEMCLFFSYYCPNFETNILLILARCIRKRKARRAKNPCDKTNFHILFRPNELFTFPVHVQVKTHKRAKRVEIRFLDSKWILDCVTETQLTISKIVQQSNRENGWQHKPDDFSFTVPARSHQIICCPNPLKTPNLIRLRVSFISSLKVEF